ncbi:MAG: macro domain-containing protein, partial [Lachnospiraceae bacterium]|nr:macro domain-containing protein [Lachnospiraceae bacterium]
MALQIIRKDLAKVEAQAIVSTGNQTAIQKTGLFGNKYCISMEVPNAEGEQEEAFRESYRKCLALAEEYQIRSIAFPLIETEDFMFSREEGLQIAASEIQAFLQTQDMQVYLVLPEEAHPNRKIAADLGRIIAQRLGLYNAMPGAALGA